MCSENLSTLCLSKKEEESALLQQYFKVHIKIQMSSVIKCHGN